MTRPSSRWKWSGERVPLMFDVALEAAAGRRLGGGELLVVGAGDRLVEHRARGSCPSCTAARSSRRRGPCIRADAPRRLAPWSEKLASPGAVQARHGGHQLVVDPEPAHRVVRRRVDPHRDRVRVLAGDPLVHLEEVPVALRHDVLPEAADRLGEVEVDAVLPRARRRGPSRRPASPPARRCRAGRGCRSSGRAARGSSPARSRGSPPAGGSSSGSCGTQTRPSLRSDSDINVSLDWNSSDCGMHVGWICV